MRMISPSTAPHAEHADHQRDPQAVENGRKHVAALFVGAEQERRLAVRGPQRRYPRIHQLQLRGIERVLHRKLRCKQRQQEKQQGHRRRHDSHFRAAERMEHVAVERALQPAGTEACALRVRLGSLGDRGVGHGDLAMPDG
jgi:hypothetical protein